MKYIIPILPIAIGFVFDAILGDPYSMPHPVKLIGFVIGKLETFVRKYFNNNLKVGGMIIVLVVLILSSGIPYIILTVCYKRNIWIGVLIESVMCYYLIAARCLRNESMKVYNHLQKNDIESARIAVSMIVGRDTDSLDENGIIKATVETVAENTSDGVTAPIMYMALGGAVLSFFYKAVNTMDSMIGYKDKKYAKLGFFAAKLDDIVNFIPSRVTAVSMIISSGILKMNMRKSFEIWKRDRLKHESPNSAQTESACAGALEVQLAGDAYYFGKLHHKETIGDPIRDIEKEDIRRSNYLMYTSSLLILILSLVFRSLVFGGIIL